MSSSGDDSNPLKKFTKDPLGQSLNILTNYATYGIIGYDDGKFGMGMATHAADETLGQITGRNMQRDALAASNAKVDAEAAQREQDRMNQLSQNQQNDMNASMAGQALRSNQPATFAGRPTQVRSGASLGGDEKDFLGI